MKKYTRIFIEIICFLFLLTGCGTIDVANTSTSSSSKIDTSSKNSKTNTSAKNSKANTSSKSSSVNTSSKTSKVNTSSKKTNISAKSSKINTSSKSSNTHVSTTSKQESEVNTSKKLIYRGKDPAVEQVYPGILYERYEGAETKTYWADVKESELPIVENTESKLVELLELHLSRAYNENIFDLSFPKTIKFKKGSKVWFKGVVFNASVYAKITKEEADNIIKQIGSHISHIDYSKKMYCDAIAYAIPLGELVGKERVEYLCENAIIYGTSSPRVAKKSIDRLVLCMLPDDTGENFEMTIAGSVIAAIKAKGEIIIE